MTNIVPFDFDGAQARVITDEHGEPWFVARDVCDILGYTKPRDAIARLDAEQRGSTVVDTLGGPQQVATVNEDGLNDLILDSRKPSAKALRRWITRDVLPSIRRHGGYLTPEAVEQVLADPDTLIRLATDIKAARAEIARREAEVVELTPRAQAWDALADSAGDYDMRDAAQILCRDPFINIGRNRLAKHLREIGWLDHRGIPYQRYVDQHLLDSKPQTRVSHRTGERIACDPQVRITLKGLGRLHHLLGGTEPLAIDTPTDTDPLEAIA